MKADRHVLTKHHEKGFGVLSTLTSGWLQCISTTQFKYVQITRLRDVAKCDCECDFVCVCVYAHLIFDTGEDLNGSPAHTRHGHTPYLYMTT